MDYFEQVMRIDDPSAAVEALVLRYSQDVWNYAYVLTRRTDVADDITQDVFLKAYRSLTRFEGRSSAKTWLLTITRNTARTYRTSAFVRRVLLMDVIEHRVHGRSAEAVSLDRLRTDEIWEIVMGLSPKYREVLMLDARFQLDTKEMAELLSIPEGTVKSRLHRAKTKVEEKLREEEQR